MMGGLTVLARSASGGFTEAQPRKRTQLIPIMCGLDFLLGPIANSTHLSGRKIFTLDILSSYDYICRSNY
jgi:hypothetical protein